MRRTIAAVAASIWLVAGTAIAQTLISGPKPDSALAPGWNPDLKLGLGLAQSSFTQNWAGDEVGTVSWLASLDGRVENQMAPKFRWLNTLVLQFGQTHQQDAERSTWLAPLKSADKIDFDSFGRFTLGGWVDPYLALTFDSQFYERRPPYGSKLINPFQLGEFAGVARAFYDTETRSLITRVGFGFRQQVQRFHGIDPSVRKEVTNDGGFEWKTIGRWTHGPTELKTDLDLFQAVYFSESDLDTANRWKQVDVRWQNSMTTKIYEMVSFNLFVDFIYDAQIRRAGQLKETLGIGLTYDMF